MPYQPFVNNRLEIEIGLLKNYKLEHVLKIGSRNKKSNT